MNKSQLTRMHILQEAFALIYSNGYRSTSIDDIIARTNVTKGAFFYHFKSKDDMGLAVINEVMFPKMYEGLFAGLQTSTHPDRDLYKVFELLLMKHPLLKPELGCPAGNLTQEMASLNTDFNAALKDMTDAWQKVIVKAVTNGKKTGVFRKDVKPAEVALMLMSGYWGVRNFGKLENSRAPYKVYLKSLKSYLKSLQ